MAIERGASASLFSIDGKLPARILMLDADCAIAEIDPRPPTGSIAILVRNGVRVCCTVGWASGSQIGLMFDHPLDERGMEDFTGSGAIAPDPNPATA